MSPLSILRIWFLGLLGFAVVGVGGYLLYEWYYGDGGREYLYWAIGLLAFAIAGRFVPRLVLGGLSSDSRPELPPAVEQRIPGFHSTDLNLNVFPNETGPVFVLTHGWSLSRVVWQYVVQSLVSQGEVVIWDLRGLGKSGKPKEADFSIDAMAHDLAAVVTHFKHRPVVLVGHSIGGMISQAFCRLHPAMLGSVVTRILLVDTTYTNPLKTALLAPLWTALQKPLIEPLLHLTVWLSPLVRVMNWSSYLNGSVHWSTRISSFAGKQTWHQLDLSCRLSSFASPAVVARGMLAMLRFDEQATLPTIPIPLAVIAGRNDRITTVEANQQLASLAQNGTFVPLDPGGHLSLLERWEPIADEVAASTPRMTPMSRRA